MKLPFSTKHWALAGSFLAIMLTSALAQVDGRAFSGFSSDNKDPIQIEADQLEVLDAQNKAIFTGNVRVRQGASIIETEKLEVTYGENEDGGQGDVEYMTLTGKVVAISKENSAKADDATYDVKKDIVTLEGNVLVAQGEKNLASGCKLVSYQKTKKTTLTACSGGRVTSIFTPGSSETN